MFKVPQGKAIVAAAAVERLPANIHDVPAYWLTRLSDFMEGPGKAFEARRLEIFKQVGTANDDGTYTLATPAQATEFSEREQELLDQEIEIPFDRISIKDLQRAEGSKYAVAEERRPQIAPAVLKALRPFLSFPDDQPLPDNVSPIRPGSTPV